MKKQQVGLIFLSLFCSATFAAEPVPESAQERFKAGVALIEKAQAPEDLVRARNELETAATLAPQWPDIHFNLARLAAETDKPAKAIKEYGLYLQLMPQAADRSRVEAEVVRLKELLARKHKIALPGVTFAAMPDGIWVMQMVPGSRIGLTGLRRGARIIAVENQSMQGATLDDFFKAIENPQFSAQGTSGSSQERGFARLSGTGRALAKNVQESGQVINLKIKWPGSEQLGNTLIKQSMFNSNLIEIEEDEFNTEVLGASLPVALTVWQDDCVPCQHFTPIIEAESARFAGKIKFVQINAQENKGTVRQLGVKGVPALLLYRAGSQVSNESGSFDQQSLSAKLNSLLGN